MKKPEIVLSVIFVIIVIISLLSCSKSMGKVSYDKYQCVVDMYSLDTTDRGSRTIWWYNDYPLPDIEVSKVLKAADMWGRLCDRDSLQHLYYTLNGKKIQPSVYPKN